MNWSDKLILIVIVWLLLGGQIPDFVSPSADPTAATYVYEKDSGGVPPEVTSAIGKLNDAGIMATTLEDDATNALDQIPAQYRITVPAAREAGLPSMVFQDGDRVLRILKSPTTEKAVLEAAQ